MVRLPENKALPWTERSREGVVLPKPSFPPEEVRVVVAEPVPRLISPPFIEASPPTVRLPVILELELEKLVVPSTVRSP